MHDTPESIAGYNNHSIPWYWTSSGIQWLDRDAFEAWNITSDGSYWPTGGYALEPNFYQRPVL